MARSPRIDAEGLVHHITGRSHAFAPAFPDGASRSRFLDLLGRVAAAHGWEIGAFSVLTTHYHLLRRTPGATLAQGMRRLQGDYARWLNRHRGTHGPVWGDRYHSRSITSQPHLVRAAAYIDRNAAVAGLVADPCDWPWSSCAANAGLRNPDPWHSPALVHGAVGDEEPSVVSTYAALVRRAGIESPAQADT